VPAIEPAPPGRMGRSRPATSGIDGARRPPPRVAGRPGSAPPGPPGARRDRGRVGGAGRAPRGLQGLAGAGRELGRWRRAPTGQDGLPSRARETGCEGRRRRRSVAGWVGAPTNGGLRADKRRAGVIRVADHRSAWGALSPSRRFASDEGGHGRVRGLRSFAAGGGSDGLTWRGPECVLDIDGCPGIIRPVAAAGAAIDALLEEPGAGSASWSQG